MLVPSKKYVMANGYNTNCENKMLLTLSEVKLYDLRYIMNESSIVYVITFNQGKDFKAIE